MPPRAMSGPVILADATRRAKRSKRRGAKGELEVAQILRDYGYPNANRNLEQSRDGGCDIINGPAYLHIEVKLTERLDLRAALRQAQDGAGARMVPVVVHRRNNERWLATADFEWLLSLVAELDDLKGLR
jgi:Holliday junction resolvase-like predicted endonuclease